MRRPLTRVITGPAIAALLLASCGADDDATSMIATPTPSATPATSPTPTSTVPEADNSAVDHYPDVLAVMARQDGDGTWTFDVTLSSPYDSASRYADAWRILGTDDTEYGVRVLTHDHATEQPFTRSLSGVAIPAHVTEVTAQGRDQVNGWGGDTVTITLDRDG